MRAEHVSPSVQAMLDVLKTVLKVEPIHSSPTARPVMLASQPINVVSRIYGDVEGHLVWGMSVIAADKIASRMIGQPVVTFDKTAARAISELGALINAQTVSSLKKRGLECTISTPLILRGSVKTSALPTRPALVFPMMLEDIGQIELSLSTFSTHAAVAV